MKRNEYPYNLALDIALPNDKQQFTEKVPEDLDSTIEFLLERVDDRRKTVLIGYYRDHKTLAAIGRDLEISGTRVSQLIRSSIKEIRRQKGGAIILMGKNKFEEKEEIRRKKCSEKEIKSFYQQVRAEREALKDVSLPAEVKESLLGIPVEDLGLEEIVVTALRRNGLNTAVDIIKFNNLPCEYHFKRVTGIGKKRFDKLKAVFEEKGIELKW